ncbi:ppg3-related protein-like protein [Leptomonas seymouri]|uniref:Ppg3-related protein-like protein n=1 Tax=Leptomonas seymouri TaxID=5684 RepID=A0A0N1IM46_LEPSE|nr:ppg3-related protein-like protein [Leptomonas seymouri]|eukprot:KPI88928.1 ppg3-related protein-like protein [Leptomonas seymouri]
MLQTQGRAHTDSSKAAGKSSFDRWLERTQRKGNRGGAGDLAGDYRKYMGELHADPRGTMRGASPQPRRQNLSLPPTTSSMPSHYALQPGSRLEELEGFLFTQNYFTRLHASPRNESEIPLGAQRSTTTYDQPYSLSLTEHPSGLPAREADFSVAGNGGAGAGGGGVGGGLSALNEPFEFTREPFGVYAPFAGHSEAERYIARLEEEVQTLTTESCEKDRLFCVAVAARDLMALQLEEMHRRSDLVRDEHAAAQTITHSFARTLSFHRVVEERSRAMELNTQISLLRHELKLAQTMREQAEITANTATASSAATQELQRRLEEQHLAQSLTSTVRGLLQQEYTQLAKLMSEMPSKMQSIIDESQTKANKGTVGESTVGTPPPQPSVSDAAETLEQRRLCALLESALATFSAAPQKETEGAKATTETRSSSNALATEPPSSLAATALSVSDSALLLDLVKRTHHFQETVLDLYCDTLSTKSNLAQYEMNIVRLIYEKQSSLSWATLYEEKKDEIRHLNEKLMELRGELRAATSTATTGASPCGRNIGGSFAGSTSSRSYEAYAAPYMPLKKTSKKCSDAAEDAGSTARSVGGSSAASPRCIPPAKKSIVELREEARRLGAHPAVHYPQPVTSRSPSMPSLFASHTPMEVEQTMLRRRSPDRSGPLPTTSERRITPPAKSPPVALIRSFAPRSGSRSSSPSTSSSSILSSIAAPSKEAQVKLPMTLAAPVEKDTRNGVSANGVRDARRVKAAAVTPKGTAAADASPPSRTSFSPASSAAKPDDTPATPIPASRGAKSKVPALQRITTIASTSSLSSPPSPPTAKVYLTNLTSSPGQAASAMSKAAGATVHKLHNSFDDDNGNDANEANLASKSAATVKQQQLFRGTTASAAPAARSSLLTKAESTTTVPATSSGTRQPAVQVKRLLLGETMKAIENAKRGVAHSDDDDLSSLSLSTTSSSILRPRPAKTSDATALAAAAKKGVALVLKTKHSHPRKSSFDDDDDSSTPSSPLPVSRGQDTRAKRKSSVSSPPISVPASRAEPAAMSASTSSNKPQKLQFPTW